MNTEDLIERHLDTNHCVHMSALKYINKVKPDFSVNTAVELFMAMSLWKKYGSGFVNKIAKHVCKVVSDENAIKKQKVQMSKRLSKLCKYGLIAKEHHDDDDKRKIFINPTEKGFGVYEGIKEEFEKTWEAFADGK